MWGRFVIISSLRARPSVVRLNGCIFGTCWTQMTIIRLDAHFFNNIGVLRASVFTEGGLSAHCVVGWAAPLTPSLCVDSSLVGALVVALERVYRAHRPFVASYTVPGVSLSVFHAESSKLTRPSNVMRIANGTASLWRGNLLNLVSMYVSDSFFFYPVYCLYPIAKLKKKLPRVYACTPPLKMCRTTFRVRPPSRWPCYQARLTSLICHSGFDKRTSHYSFLVQNGTTGSQLKRSLGGNIVSLGRAK